MKSQNNMKFRNIYDASHYEFSNSINLSVYKSITSNKNIYTSELENLLNMIELEQHLDEIRCTMRKKYPSIHFKSDTIDPKGHKCLRQIKHNIINIIPSIQISTEFNYLSKEQQLQKLHIIINKKLDEVTNIHTY